MCKQLHRQCSILACLHLIFTQIFLDAGFFSGLSVLHNLVVSCSESFTELNWTLLITLAIALRVCDAGLKWAWDEMECW